MGAKKNQDHVFYRNPNKYYPTAQRGEGIYIYDTDGKEYIDGSGGAAVVNIGHGVREIQEAMLKQASFISFTHGTQFTTEAAIELAEKITRIAPPGLERGVFSFRRFGGRGDRSKMARQYQVDRGVPSKYKVISRWTSYHGNTLGSAGIKRTHQTPAVLPAIAGPYPHIVPAYCYRCPFGRKPDACNLECADALEATILYEGPDSVSAFMAEPVVGATAGALVPKDGYFQRIREICDTYDVLLIVDEVMTGIGRTGKHFGIDHWNVIPDMIICAKGLASGYTPIYCVVTQEKIRTAILEGNGAFVHGHTYSQNPLSCAIASAVLDYIRDNDLVSRSARMGAYLLEKLQTLYRHAIVGDVRGLGLFAGIEFVEDRTTKKPFDASLKLNILIGNRAFDKGLVSYPGGGGADGVNGDHILLAPHFIITEEQIDRLVAILDESIEEIAREKNLPR